MLLGGGEDGDPDVEDSRVVLDAGADIPTEVTFNEGDVGEGDAVGVGVELHEATVRLNPTGKIENIQQTWSLQRKGQ
jgi:hypothetical protein